MTLPTLNTTLSTQAFYILLALTDKTLHGYDILDQVANDSHGRLIMASGTTYGLLKRLTAEKLIERTNITEPRITCRYRLTAYSRRLLESEVRRLEYVVAHAHYKLGRKIGR